MKKIDSSGKLPTISFITISKYNSKELVDTINSLLDQINEENIEYIIVISERLSHEIKNMIFKKRESINLKLIECRDKGLYDAMNLGISSSTGKYLYFLNAGDLLIDKKLNSLCSYINENEPCNCLAFSTVQSIGKRKWIRNPVNNILFPFLQSKMLPPHQGFLSPNTKERIFFNTQLKLTADSSWMRESIKKFGVIYFNEVICDFELNGISSVPSIRLIRLRLFEKNYHLVLSEMVKLFLFILLGADNYFKITFYLKGMKKI